MTGWNFNEYELSSLRFILSLVVLFVGFIVTLAILHTIKDTHEISQQTEQLRYQWKIDSLKAAQNGKRLSPTSD